MKKRKEHASTEEANNKHANNDLKMQWLIAWLSQPRPPPRLSSANPSPADGTGHTEFQHNIESLT